MNRIAVCIGGLFAVAGGVALDQACLEGTGVAWELGALGLLVGALLVASGIRSGDHLVPPSALGPSKPLASVEPPAPELGQLLVRRGLISGMDLARALAAQQDTGKRLGEVLLAMKLISRVEMEEAMEEQRLYRQHGFVWRG
jgi:hypothetical protein